MEPQRNGARFAGLTICLLVLGACSGREPGFDANRITEDVRQLSSDDFAGRAPASPGEEKTVAYLIAQLRAAGVEPGGELQADGNRGWTQDVLLRRAVIASPLDARFTKGRESRVLVQSEDIAIRGSQSGGAEVRLENAPLVFVGYGVSAPERQWDDFKGMDLKGKVALFLVNDPDFETGEGDFGGKAMTYYGRWTYKYEEAARRGAAGALVIHETAPASYGWSTVSNPSSLEHLDVRRENPLEAHAPIEGWIQRDVVAELMGRAGLDFEQLKAAARTREFQPVELAGLGFSARFAVDIDDIVTRNVIGALPGRQHPDEWILYTAHWDHLGTDPANTTGDAIYNGAVDNATGTALVLELARNFARAKRTARSIAFLFVGAEEHGLLGSEYYASNPLYPLATTVANLNCDSQFPIAPARNFTTSGNAPLTLQDLLVEEGAKRDRSYMPEPRPEAGLFFRSDHFSFARRGVPAISFKTGNDLVEGGVAAGDAWYEDYNSNRYHQTADNFDAATWRSDGIANDAALLHALGRRLAESREWPEWKQGAEFKALRDASAGERP